MSFEREQHSKKFEVWTELVDDSLGRHKDEVLSVLRRATTPDQVIAMLANYMHGEAGVSEISARDNADKLGMKMPEFQDSEEEALWNLFVEFRSDQYTE